MRGWASDSCQRRSLFRLACLNVNTIPYVRSVHSIVWSSLVILISHCNMSMPRPYHSQPLSYKSDSVSLQHLVSWIKFDCGNDECIPRFCKVYCVAQNAGIARLLSRSNQPLRGPLLVWARVRQSVALVTVTTYPATYTDTVRRWNYIHRSEL